MFESVFKKQKPQEIIFHPKFRLPIKYAFECDGQHFYSLVNDYEMPKKRFAFAQTFYQETQSKITTETLREFCEAIKKQLDEGKLGAAYKLVDELDYRNDWLFEPDTLYRFASVIYFKLEENLSDYDMDYNKAKIASFKKKDKLTYFLEMLFSGQKLLSTLSPEDLKVYLSKLEEIKERQQKLISGATA